jgi:single-strand DNA-binding protein
VASFRLATTERYRDRNGETHENTEWHSIVAWRSSADYVEKYVHKGSQLYIEGKLRTRQWTDQSGNKRFTTEIQADNMQLLGKRPDGQQGQPQGGYNGQPQGYNNQPQGGYQGPGYGSQPVSQPAPQPAYSAPVQPAFQAPAPQPAPADDPNDDLPF